MEATRLGVAVAVWQWGGGEATRLGVAVAVWQWGGVEATRLGVAVAGSLAEIKHK